jgi:4-amino-4-deoxy-L-arabinose transferase-like glycosyltransferase
MTSLAAQRDARAAGAAGGADAAGVTDLAGRLLAALGASHARACATLVLLCLACYLPGLASLQPMDRDEPRFAQASKQMLETGDLVDIRFQAEARHKKPVGIYWLQAASVSAGAALGVPDARRAIWLYRLPSLLGAVAAVLLVYWTALAFLDRARALLAAGLIGACVLLTVEAHLAKTDAVLAACAAAAMGGLARAWLRRGEPLPPAPAIVFWAGVAAGVLVKGPMVPFFVALPALALSWRARSGRWLLALRPLPGLAAVLLVCAPWFLAIALRSHGAFYAEAVGHDMLGKVGTAQTQHWAPPGTYLLVTVATFWPASVLALLAIPFAWAHRREDATAFLLAWAVPAWIVLELVPTKLPHYVLPLLPALAILAVLALARGDVHPRRPGSRAVALLWPVLPAALAVGLCVAGLRLDGAVPWAALPLLGAAIGLAALAWRAFAAGRAAAAPVLAVLAAALVGPAVLGLAAPVLASLKISPRLAALREAAPCRNPATASLGYREPSLIFLVGTDLALIEGGEAGAAFLAGGGCRLLFVEGRQEAGFREAAARAGLAARLVGRVGGLNINGGRLLDVAAYGTAP